MNRRSFIKNSALASFALGSGAHRLAAHDEAGGTKSPTSSLARITPPVLQNMSENGVTVFWSVSSPATGWVEFGETESLGRIARGEDGGLLPLDARVLRVRLDGLLAGRKYFYRVHTMPVDFKGPYDIRRGAAVAGPMHSFTTFAASAPTASFIMWNDTHQKPETLAKLVEKLAGQPSDFLLWNGDIFNDVADDEMLIAETLHPAGLEYAATRPLAFTRGNHDVRGLHARHLARTLEPRDGKYYFFFRQGPVAFLGLDTGEDKDDGHPEYGGLGDFASYRTEQQAWLEQTIARDDFRSARFRVLFSHIPLRGPGESKDSRAKWEPLLRTAGIDLALSGHTHRYAYNEPTPEQPWPLVIGGAPQPDRATYIHGQASAEKLVLRMFALDGRELGQWSIGART